MNNIKKLTIFNLKKNKKNLITWTIVISLITFIYMILFPYVKEIAQAEIDMMPPEMLSLFLKNEETSMYNYTNYFEIIYNMIILAICVFAANYPNQLKIEENNKTQNYYVNMGIKREDIYFSKKISSIISTFILTSAVIIITILCGIINKEQTLNIFEILKSGIIISLIPFIFIGYSMFLSTTKIPNFLAPSLIFIIYMIGYLGILLDSSIISKLSLFITFNKTNSNLIIYLIIYLVIHIIFTILGCKKFKNKDLYL